VRARRVDGMMSTMAVSATASGSSSPAWGTVDPRMVLQGRRYRLTIVIPRAILTASSTDRHITTVEQDHQRVTDDAVTAWIPVRNLLAVQDPCRIERRYRCPSPAR